VILPSSSERPIRVPTPGEVLDAVPGGVARKGRTSSYARSVGIGRVSRRGFDSPHLHCTVTSSPNLGGMTELDLMWLVGLLEGEGSFIFPAPSEPTSPRVTLQMTDEDVVRRAARLMGIEYVHKSHRHPDIWKPTYQVSLKGKRARALMEQLLPYMGVRRSQRIRGILALRPPGVAGENTRKLSDEQVREIYRLCLTGESTERIASEYNVSGWLVRQIRAGKHRYKASRA
jgi:hypothetical protein